MEEPSNYRRTAGFPHPEPSRGKPFTHFLLKALFFASILVVVPLFPSQAPDFIAESVVTKFWELIHLLFIGIAVSYGLFCRRNAETEIDTESTLDSLQHNMSRMFHLPAPRSDDDGCENPYGDAEKRAIHGEEQWKSNPDFSFSENGVRKSEVQSWNSQFFQGESMVIVARPNCGFDEFSESRSVGDYRPLGLPVRSLKSRATKRESSELFSRADSGSSFENSFDESETVAFTDSEQKLDEALASPSPIPWCSRSASRPRSVDETQFESMPFSSQEDDSSEHSVASETMDSNLEDDETNSPASLASFAPPSQPKPIHRPSGSLGSQSPPKPIKAIVRRAKSYQGSSSSSGFPLPPNPIEEEAPRTELAVKDYYSLGSLRENGLTSPKDHCNEPSDPEPSSLKKPTGLKKVLLRGKSVRTNRPSRLAAKTANSGHSPGNQAEEIDNPGFATNHALLEDQATETREFSENVCNNEEAEFNIESLSEDLGNLGSESVKDPKPAECDEVDKKAGEFIAKFREQIRLQKVASMERSRGLQFRQQLF